jgi:hypothetical protein
LISLFSLEEPLVYVDYKQSGYNDSLEDKGVSERGGEQLVSFLSVRFSVEK